VRFRDRVFVVEKEQQRCDDDFVFVQVDDKQRQSVDSPKRSFDEDLLLVFFFSTTSRTLGRAGRRKTKISCGGRRERAPARGTSQVQAPAKRRVRGDVFVRYGRVREI
jgi:hypothetical protein